MPDALERKVCEPTEKAVAVIAAITNLLLGITAKWDRTSQIQRSREVGESRYNSMHRWAAAFVISLTYFSPEVMLLTHAPSFTVCWNSFCQEDLFLSLPKCSIAAQT